MANTLTADVCIVGAGLVGAAQALALARHNISSIVIDKTTPPSMEHLPVDGRVSAISYASQHVLRHIGLWDDLLPHAGPIEKILVTEGGKRSDIMFDCDEVGEEPFGHMIPNTRLRQLSACRMDDYDAITTCYNTTIASLDCSHGVHIQCENGQEVQADMLVVADGRYSSMRDMIGVKARKFDYHQHAIVCTVEHSAHHKNVAVEWFFPEGPLALLPMAGGHHSCIVWTEEDVLAKHLVVLDEADFVEELRRKLQGMLGDIALDSDRFAYPLNLFQAASYIAPHAALIGDAAHAIHPIAGQGVNLGYRDVAALTQILVEGKQHGQYLGAASLLADYQRWRSFDATAMIATTDILNRLFSSNSTLLRPFRRTGMAAFSRAHGMKSFFMRSAMGMEGELPDMLQGIALSDGI